MIDMNWFNPGTFVYGIVCMLIGMFIGWSVHRPIKQSEDGN